MVLCISPVSFGMIPQPCHGLMESSYHRFFLLLDRGAKPGNTWWCLTTEPNWSLYELSLLVKWNNPQILFFHMQNEIVSEIQLSLGLHSEVTVPRSPPRLHARCCMWSYVWFPWYFFFWNNNKYFSSRNVWPQRAGADAVCACAPWASELKTSYAQRVQLHVRKMQWLALSKDLARIFSLSFAFYMAMSCFTGHLSNMQLFMYGFEDLASSHTEG